MVLIFEMIYGRESLAGDVLDFIVFFLIDLCSGEFENLQGRGYDGRVLLETSSDLVSLIGIVRFFRVVVPCISRLPLWISLIIGRISNHYPAV